MTAKNQKVAQCQQTLRRFGLDALVVRLSENVTMLSGYWPLNGFSFVFVPAVGAAVLLCPECDREEAAQSTVKTVHCFASGRLTDGDAYENAGALLQQAARQCGLPPQAAVGVDTGSDAVSLPLCSGEVGVPGDATLQMIRNALETDRLVPAQSLITELRSEKDGFAIQKIRAANRLAHAATEHFAMAVQEPGCREIDAAARTEAFVAQHAADYGIRYAKAWAQVSSGPRTSESWVSGLVSTERVLCKGDIVMLELGLCADGYWSDLTETVGVGGMTEEQARIAGIVRAAQQKAIATVREGVTCGEVDQAARSVIEAAGLGERFFHNTGHGVGYCYHESVPILRPGADTVLKAGMIHSVEPGIYLPGEFGIRLECNVLVQKDCGIAL